MIRIVFHEFHDDVSRGLEPALTSAQASSLRLLSYRLSQGLRNGVLVLEVGLKGGRVVEVEIGIAVEVQLVHAGTITRDILAGEAKLELGKVE